MKRFGKRTLSVLLAGSMLLGDAAVSIKTEPVYAAESQTAEEKPKYIKDVFIAYGKTKEEAGNWLKNHGWEVIPGNCDFNAGKASYGGENVAAVMGIKRTDDVKYAITDMAVMNMSGEYHTDTYEKLVGDKKAEIDKFIESFLPAIEEYRVNYEKSIQEGETGYKRAQIAHDLLNKFIDGDPEDKYAGNDTGKRLGDLLLQKIRQEGGEEGSCDLQQIILESSGAVVLAIENALAMATDTGKNTWIDRLSDITSNHLMEHVADYCPEAEGQDVAPSAAMNYYLQDYGHAAECMADQWGDIHDKMKWYEQFCDDHDLVRHDEESDEEFHERVSGFVEDLGSEESAGPEQNEGSAEKFNDFGSLYCGLYTVDYEGDWGKTLGDFFNPQVEDCSYADETESYLPMATALSEGQKSALGTVSLYKMLMLGFTTEESEEKVSEMFDTILEGREDISVYTGINRGIFRSGVAMTPEIITKRAVDPYNTDDRDIRNIIGYLAIGLGAALGIGALGVFAHARYERNTWIRDLSDLSKRFEFADSNLQKTSDERWMPNKYRNSSLSTITEEIDEGDSVVLNVQQNLQDVEEGIQYGQINTTQQAGGEVSQEIIEKAEEVCEYKEWCTLSAVMTCIGVAFVALGVYTTINNIRKANEAKEEYIHRNFTEIPKMVVDEKDIVSYKEDKDGNKRKVIAFEQCMYYEAVRCNRQDVGALSEWQSGVEKYESLGCGDLADLNCDHGKEWLALYVNRSKENAFPILADSLYLAYGDSKKSAKAPEMQNALSTLHYFSNLGRVNLADEAFCYNNASDKKYMYFFWTVDKEVNSSAGNTK